ncbi:teichoic acid transport system ATP-binding protein [Humibacillus xanthopallidus]|uniref:Teichoic acid transport system ATP-binding protein n=1 Tax=Humibacillus xanthopallidus TaxID=412689 RepID=A0A543PP88_9MICO|nr:ABC transporter ATP-binding protein [Humibacillus xanthopallidus]TQN45894.1 teichoic acid transport system ATP-binding protein [Humibacillus xanthopallidus]
MEATETVRDRDRTGAREATPSVICSELDIVYTVFGARKKATTTEGEQPWLERILRQRRQVDVGNVRKVHAVKGVSFVVRHGEAVGIIGRNGSGKSTLLRAIAGLIPPSGGRAWAAGRPALLGVNAVLLTGLTGSRNVMIGGLALGLSPREVRERYDDIVEFSGIGDFVDLPMSAYSSGMGARLRFAISTAAAPDILMIDEALATGDAEFQTRSRERIAEIREQAGTVFLVSHSNAAIRESCDRVLWMDQGRLIMDGPTEDVVAAYEASHRKGGR